MMRLSAVPKTRGMSPAEAAAHWVVRHDRGDLSASEQAEFGQWFDDPINAAAFAKVNGALELFDADDGHDPHLRALRQAALETAPAPRRRWQAAAAGFAAIGLAGLLVFTSLDRPGSDPAPSAITADTGSGAPQPAASPSAPAEYATRIGERRTITLPDGSRVTLNTRSRLAVAFTAERRLVRLSQGQALFEVARDASRPFTVEAADRQITALGTIFEVRVDPGRMRVMLIEGRVAVDRLSDAESAQSAAAAPAILNPGQEYVAEFGTPQRIAAVDVSRRLLWRDGFVEFDDEPLGRAVAEINRYTSRSIVLSDDGVAALRLSGVFRTGNPDRFVSTAGEILPIEARPTPEGQIELSLAERAAR